MSYERTIRGLGRPEQAWSTRAQATTDEMLTACADVFAAACRSRPSKKFPRDPTRSPRLLYGRGLGVDEAGGFVRALEHGLIVLAPDGGFQVPGARACSKNLHLVGRNEDHVALHTEVLVHITSYAELVLDHGWEESCLVFDPFVRGAALDLWGFARAADGPWWEGEITFASEAKARVDGPDGLRSLLASLLALSSDPATSASNNHLAKWREIVTLTRDRDINLLLVADGARWWYRVSRHGESALLSDPGS
ncbi:hypothetical protein V6K52_03500 [Knoellia sp. S7-12]|uniref:hypothetical protein n=1 Tax=Knoellia sp. S7-12 TaxID=3126698 RepID=UPI003369193A